KEEQLSLFESEPELDGSRQTRATAPCSQVKVRRFFQNKLTSSQYASRHADRYPTLRYNPEGFLGTLYSNDSLDSSPPTSSVFAGCEAGVRSGRREYLPSEVR